MKKFRYSFIAAAASFLLIFAFTACESIPINWDTSGLSESDAALVNSIKSSVESIEKAAETISPEDEYNIGRAVAASIATTYTIDQKNPAMSAYLNKICKTLVMNSEKPYLYKDYCVAIMDTDEINAMATPGGHIFVSRGIIKNCDSEDALAAILAHEISHIQLGHSVKAIKASRVRAATTDTAKAGVITSLTVANASNKDESTKLSEEEMKDLLNTVDTLSSASNEVVKTLVNTGFSKEQEFEADSLAVSIMNDAGYDSYAILDILGQIQKSKSNSGWGATHPSAADRIKNVSKDLAGIEKSEAIQNGKALRTKRFKTAYARYK